MTRILFFVAAAAAVYWFYKRFTSDAEKLARSHKRKARSHRTASNGKLVKDPKTGEYHVKKDEDV